MTAIQGIGLALAYLIGAVPVGLTIGLLRGVDVRKIGSGNIGATNVMRGLGPALGIFVFLVDVFKGVAAVLLCRHLGMEGWLLSMGALFAVLGHCFSPYLGFKGGKGVATALGITFGLQPLAALIAFGLWFVIVLPTRLVSLASIVGAIAIPVSFYLIQPDAAEATVPLAALTLVVIGRHSENIERLLKGEEKRFGSKKSAEAAPPEAETAER
jgi:glycerol-3-phosphate acyltransferase PlsY